MSLHDLTFPDPADSTCDILESTTCFGSVILDTLFDVSVTFDFNSIVSLDFSAVGMGGSSPFSFGVSLQASAAAYCE